MSQCDLRLHSLTLNGQLDYGVNCEPALELPDENLDAANTQVTADDPAAIQVTVQYVPTEDERVGSTNLPANKSLVFRLTVVGSTTGDQTLTLKVQGMSGTIQIYQLVVEVRQFANCPFAP